MAKAVQAYTAVGISPTVRGVLKQEQSKTNIEDIHEVCAAACWLSSLDSPVRLMKASGCAGEQEKGKGR